MEVNSKTAWWLQHKNDPKIIECMREARRKYYYKNQEREKQRGRDYYYAKKALACLAEVNTLAQQVVELPSFADVVNAQHSPAVRM